MLPFPGKSTTTLRSVGKHFTLRFPHIAGRSRQSGASNPTGKLLQPPASPTAVRRSSSGGGSPAWHYQLLLQLLVENQSFFQCCILSQGYTRTWRKSTPYSGGIGQDTKKNPRIYPHPPRDFSSQPKTSLRSNIYLKTSLSQTICLEV